MNYIDDFLKNVIKQDKVVSKFLSLEDQSLCNKIKNKVLIPEDCERKRVIIGYDKINYDDYISVIKITYNKKYGLISHKDVLGSLIGLGIKRECIGDIFVSDDIFVIVIKEMEQYILNNLMTIGKCNVNTVLSDFNCVKELNIEMYIEDTMIVSSYRLDTIISERCNFSREKAKQYIILKNVKVNGSVNVNPDYIVKIDDLISIHKYGRLIVKEELNKTKKDKYVLRVFKTK